MSANDPHLDELDNSLPKLLDAYRRAWLFVENRGAVEMFREVPDQGKTDPGPLARLIRQIATPIRLPVRAWMQIWEGIFIRPIVRMFLESHIRHRARLMRKFLLVQMLSPDLGDRKESLDEYVKRLEGLQMSMSGWDKLRILIPFGSLTPAVIAVLVSMLAGATAEETAKITLVIAVLVPTAFIAAFPFAVQFGFRWKHGIVRGRMSKRDALKFRPQIFEPRLPDTEILDLERRVFLSLGSQVPSELPIDLILHPRRWAFLSTSVVLTVVAVAVRPPFLPGVFLLVFFWFATIMFIGESFLAIGSRKRQNQP